MKTSVHPRNTPLPAAVRHQPDAPVEVRGGFDRPVSTGAFVLILIAFIVLAIAASLFA